MLRALLFDFNGVIVDDEPLHFALFKRVLAEEGLELAEADYYARYLGFDDRACFEAVLREAGQLPEVGRVMRLITRKAAYYSEEIHRAGYPFFRGAVELVRSAAAADLMLGVVSGALREEVEGALRQAGIEHCFKLLVTAEDVSRSKPDPEGYRLGLEGLNSLPPFPDRLVHPHEVLVIEDSPAGIEAAKALGLPTLGVAHTYTVDRLGGADVTTQDLAGVGLAALTELYRRATS